MSFYIHLTHVFIGCLLCVSHSFTCLGDKIPAFLNDFFLFFSKDLFIYRERGKEGEGEREKPQWVVASCTSPNGELAHNPGMSPDWNRISNPVVHRLALNPLSHTSQGFFSSS